MKNTSYLFRMINTMTQSEKRYFRIFSSMQVKGDGNKNKYVSLFDELNKMEEYDEKKLQSTFKSFLTEGSLTVGKLYLYNMILKSLRNYHSNSNIDIQLRDMLTNIQILYNKRMLNEALSQIAKAQELAELYEKFSILIELRRYKNNIYIEINDEKKLNELYSELYEKENEYLEKLRNINEYNRLQHLLVYKIKMYDTARIQDEAAGLNEIISNPLLQDEKSAITNYSRLLFYQIKFYYAFYTQNIEEEYIFSKKTIDFQKANPQLIKENQRRYIYTLTNHLYPCRKNKKYDEALDYCNQIITLLDKSDIDKNRVISNLFMIFSIQLDIYSRTKQFNEALMLIEEIINNKEYKEAFNQEDESRVELYFYIAKLLIESGLYKKSLYWNNKLINMKNNIPGQFLINIGNILNLIIHTELGNDDLLRYRITSVYRYLYKNKKLYKMEDTILHFIKKLTNIDTQKKFTSLLEELKAELIKISADPYEAKFLDYFDFVTWIDKKINNPSTGIPNI